MGRGHAQVCCEEWRNGCVDAECSSCGNVRHVGNAFGQTGCQEGLRVRASSASHGVIRSRPGGQEVTNDRAGGKQRHERHFQMHDSAQGHGQPHTVNIWVHQGALSTAWRAHAYGQARAMRRGKGMSGRRGMWCVGDIDERAPSCELNKHTTQPARKHTARARTARARAAGARNASTGSASAHTHAQHQNKAPAGAPPRCRRR